MTDNQLIEITKNFVKETLKHAEGGHDWFHTERVYKNALLISKTEAVDILVVQLGAWFQRKNHRHLRSEDRSVGKHSNLPCL